MQPCSDPPPRLVSDQEFPPYSYVSGQFPHPTSDPAGHSHGHAPSSPPELKAETWPQSRDYLWGCDLFNHGYYWEAHETWEALWNASGRGGVTADFLKGLIKLAAAGVKARECNLEGVHRHAARAAELFTQVQATFNRPADRLFGLDLHWLIETAKRVATTFALAEEPVRPTPVVVVFDFYLVPQAHGPTPCN